MADRPRTETASAPAWQRAQWLRWAGVPLLLLAVTLPLLPAQQPLFLQLNHLAAAQPEALWAFCTLLGDTNVLFALLSPLLLWRPQAAMAAMAAVPAGGLFSVLAKHWFDAPRPGGVLDVAQFHLIGPLLSTHSFPSGHTITAFAATSAVLATLAPPLGPRKGTALMLLLISAAAAVGFSRVAVGAHWPLDVLVGACGGWLAGLSGAWLTRRYPAFWQSLTSQRILAGLWGAIGIWLVWRPLDYPQGVAAIWLAAGCSWLTVAGLLMRWRRTR